MEEDYTWLVRKSKLRYGEYFAILVSSRLYSIGLFMFVSIEENDVKVI